MDPGGNETIYTFTGFSSAGGSATYAQVLTDIKRYQGTSTVLSEDAYCYNTAFASCLFASAPTTTVTYPITSVIVMHKLGTMSTTSATETHYDSYGNLTYSAQYGFGGSSPARATTITYGTWGGSSCSSIGNYVNNRPCDVLTTQSGNNVAESHFIYDSHGNLLKTSVSNGSAWIGQTIANSYKPNGTPSATYDVANNSTTYLYDSTKYMHCASCTQYPFPTSISKGGLTTSSTWDGYGAVKLTDVDASGNTTTYGYGSDPFSRVTSIQDPLGNIVNKTYPTGSSPDSANSSFAFNINSIQNTTQTTDVYGRTTNVQTQQSPTATNYDTVSTAYGWSGNYRTVANSQPCSVTSGGTCATVHTNYLDPLGRLYQHTTTYNEELTHTYTQNDDLSVLSFPPSGENNKQVQTQYDGLGRPTSVCAISSMVSGNVSCGQNTNTSATGVLTTTSYTSATGSQTVSSTRGSQTRSQTYDALGRVTLVATPEGGTINYYYDSYPGVCGYTTLSEPGHLVYKVFANGNNSCYLYDGLGRLTVDSATVSGSGVWSCRKLFYDNSTGYSGTIPSGITVNNSMGRIAEAATDDCNGHLVTDEWFSYDKNGHMTDMWELTPHSGTYYHSHATFAGNGAPLAVQLANPSLYTETYGLDGEGRLATLSSTGTTIVGGTTYNASSQPTYIDLGTGTDQSDYGWDPNTGRMKNWTFQVGNASETGTLTWNANGTLRQLAIVDGFNSGGSQTCTFGTSTVMGYDDLGRLLSDNCGSVWQQTFSYDQYDNLTKSGSSAWNPGYNPANNHYSAGASYDNSGNVTSDPSHTYKWDSFNKVQSIDSSSCGSNGECITYDALGRMVETSYSGVYTEIWYTQLGKTVYMHGSTPQYAYWPTPGKGTVEVNGNNSTFYYMHKDWLGNSRISSVIGSSQVVSDQAYAPYGEVYNKQATGASTPAQMFTGDTQDVIAGIFDTPNRELNASQGRWLSPDPAGASWNQYAYPTNPNIFFDPSGLIFWANCGSGYCLPIGSTYSGGGFAGYVPDSNGTDSSSGSSVGSNGETVGADSGSSPQLCFCSDDLTSGVLDGTSFDPYAPATIVQLGYAAPNTEDLNSSYYGPYVNSDGASGYEGIASVKYQVFDTLGNLMANATISESLFQLDGNVDRATQETWNTDSQGVTYDRAGLTNYSSGAYNVEFQQFYAIQNGKNIYLTPTYTQTSYVSNGTVVVYVTANNP